MTALPSRTSPTTRTSSISTRSGVHTAVAGTPDPPPYANAAKIAPDTPMSMRDAPTMLSGMAARGKDRRVSTVRLARKLGTPNIKLLAKKVQGTMAAMAKVT